ncbi:acetoacetate decarboxylase family protein [Bradyrhizobium sp. LB11.1]|uniref:acetoacetate decarboxylase family protein n=1 Tax=Bradyrhizobium sp. LB11.1 TaxID=3156326 RepID=UPI003395A3E1
MKELIDRRKRHRMPVVFGPTVGPRQGPDGQAYDYSESPRASVAVSFLSEADALTQLLPPGCRLDGEPIVTVERSDLLEVEWLAGRAYSMLAIKFPVAFEGERDCVRGPFLSVLWENRPEPIISGREELGFAKLYCELPPPRAVGGVYEWSALWDGHEFLRLGLSDLADADPPPPTLPIDGTLHHRYLPGLSEPGLADLEQIVMSPSGARVRTISYRKGKPSIAFVRSTWEQLPTMYHIVNALADLPIKEMRAGCLAETRGASDFSNQRVLS